MNEESRYAHGMRSFDGRHNDPVRVAAIHDDLAAVNADAAAIHDDPIGIGETLRALRLRGVRGYELELIGPDTGRGDLLELLAARRHDLVHLCAPGPRTAEVLALARALDLPVTAAYETGSLAGARPPARASGIDAVTEYAPGSFDAAGVLVLSPSRAADVALHASGIRCSQIHRWVPGVDFECFTPARYHPDAIPAAGSARPPRTHILYAGRLDAQDGLELLADAFLRAREHDTRLHLVLAGEGPEELRLRRRLGGAATFLGRTARDELARVYASADLLVFPNSGAAFGRVVLEAQASGLPVLAVDSGGGAELIQSGRSGCLAPVSAAAMAAAIHGLARRPPLRERLVTGGLAAVREHSWELSLLQLADIWDVARGAAQAERSPMREAAHAA